MSPQFTENLLFTDKIDDPKQLGMKALDVWQSSVISLDTSELHLLNSMIREESAICRTMKSVGRWQTYGPVIKFTSSKIRASSSMVAVNHLLPNSRLLLSTEPFCTPHLVDLASIAYIRDSCVGSIVKKAWVWPRPTES